MKGRPQVGHKLRPVALQAADSAHRRLAGFLRPGVSPNAKGAEGGKTAPRVPQGAVCDQLAPAGLCARTGFRAALAKRELPGKVVGAGGPRSRSQVTREDADEAAAFPSGRAWSVQGFRWIRVGVALEPRKLEPRLHARFLRAPRSSFSCGCGDGAVSR